MPKKGERSVGVAAQYASSLQNGKLPNAGIADTCAAKCP
nr:hypothetical protein [Bradyrhizobium sp. CCBAU 53415]